MKAILNKKNNKLPFIPNKSPIACPVSHIPREIFIHSPKI